MSRCRVRSRSSAGTTAKWTSAPACCASAACRTKCANAGSFDPAADTIKVLTMHVSKGLEFPVLALVGAGRMPAEG
jgi:hypothetical protein